MSVLIWPCFEALAKMWNRDEAQGDSGALGRWTKWEGLEMGRMAMNEVLLEKVTLH